MNLVPFSARIATSHVPSAERRVYGTPVAPPTGKSDLIALKFDHHGYHCSIPAAT